MYKAIESATFLYITKIHHLASDILSVQHDGFNWLNVKQLS